MPPRLSLQPSRPFSNYVPVNCTNAILISPRKRGFVTTSRNATRLRQSMWAWLRSDGTKFQEHTPGVPNHLGSYAKNGELRFDANARRVPFPQNTSFQSEQVTSEEVRQTVWEDVMKLGKSVKTVSAERGIEMRRVAAIVRLQEIQQEWVKEGKRLARPYSKAVMSMLPQTYLSDLTHSRHESINDLPVHAATRQQIFYPTSESRRFTREDAARAFDEALLPADRRIPHPELTKLQESDLVGVPYAKRVLKALEQEDNSARKKSATDGQSLEKQKGKVKVVNGRRWEFKFQSISVDDAGWNGRGSKGTGWRYGVPHTDRKRGQIKIPTQVV